MRGDNLIDSEQFYDFITSEELSWQSLIYDLIKTEQLDPWDIDVGILADRYLEAIQTLEEADLNISSKVLLACSILLQIKSKILVHGFIEELNAELYGRKASEAPEIERIEIDESELPILTPRTPMARHKKVTLNELMSALGKAIDTETRRIKREIKDRQAEKSALVVMPKSTHIPLKIRVKSIFGLVSQHMGKGNTHMKFFSLAPSKEEKLASFIPILHLSNDQKLHLWQEDHFDDIHMAFDMHPEERRLREEEIGFAEEESVIPSK